jgi:RNA polymerase sigma-70 factor (ECF subfamily)
LGRVLDPEVVWTSDGGGGAHAAAQVARALAALSRRVVHEPIEIKLNGRLGLVRPGGDGHRAAVSFVVSDGRITRIDAIRKPRSCGASGHACLTTPDAASARPRCRAQV